MAFLYGHGTTEIGDADIEEGWAAMVELKEQGKVRHIGVSNQTVAQIERLQAIHPVASLQPPYLAVIHAALVEREGEE